MTDSPETIESASTLSLIRGIATDVQDVAAAELTAAKLEAKLELGRLKQAIVWSVALGALGLLCGIALTHAAALALAPALGIGAAGSYLLIGAVFGVLMVVSLIVIRRRSKDIDLVPEETIKDVKEDAEWMQHQIKSAVK